jgi:DNA primase small subunit
MSNSTYLKRIFQSYYKENKSKIPAVNTFDKREFAIIPWEKEIMIRHMGFTNQDDFLRYVIGQGPKHIYSSGSLYLQPDNQNMEQKQYQGCDLIVDIDVDHFYTPCKDNHDVWYCKECGKSGKGMLNKCPDCKSTKIESVSWICENCLKIAKNEIKKLIFDFLIPDFGIKEEQMKIAFSGHRGYHLKIEEDRIRSLSSDCRREIVDYVSGKNLSYDILGLKESSSGIYGLTKDGLGWAQKIAKKTEENLTKSDDNELVLKLNNYGLSQNQVKSFMNYKDDFLQILINNKRIWSIEGFGLTTWKTFLNGIVREIGVELDEPVTIDIHRLIRYPGSLHGKTGFKVQEIQFNELEDFNPLTENNEKKDPIVFYSKKTQKIEIVEQEVPATKIKDETFGPYKKGEIIDVPHHMAIFLLCKNVAKTI